MRRAEAAGVRSAWVSGGGLGADSLTMIALAASRTTQILLGTSIAITHLRHPLAMAQQAIAISQVAPGRFRLGIGTSHRPTVENVYGLAFERPIEQLREYAIVLRRLFRTGGVDLDGRRYRVHARIAGPLNVPLYLAALRARLYQLAGEVGDGAISWATPPSFLSRVARPALLAGAAAGGNTVDPRLVGHAFGLVTDDEGEVLRVGRERMAKYTHMAFYREMFAAAGYPEMRDGVVSEAVMHDVVLVGDERRVAEGIQRFFGSGADELILTLIPAGRDRERSIDRTLALLGSSDLSGGSRRPDAAGA